MRRFHQALEAYHDKPVFLSQLCSELGVSARTLRWCCQEHLGIGPKRYLDLRRLHLARYALTHGSPDADSVTDIATQFGFWELGRFPVEYRSLFGESPSATLKLQAN